LCGGRNSEWNWPSRDNSSSSCRCKWVIIGNCLWRLRRGNCLCIKQIRERARKEGGREGGGGGKGTACEKRITIFRIYMESIVLTFRTVLLVHIALSLVVFLAALCSNVTCTYEIRYFPVACVNGTVIMGCSVITVCCSGNTQYRTPVKIVYSARPRNASSRVFDKIVTFLRRISLHGNSRRIILTLSIILCEIQHYHDVRCYIYMLVNIDSTVVKLWNHSILRLRSSQIQGIARAQESLLPRWGMFPFNLRTMLYKVEQSRNSISICSKTTFLFYFFSPLKRG